METVAAPAVPEPKPAAPAQPAVPAAADAEKLQAALLAIVSEKTGYPVETLELDMDMEADLGIDSIKRVEILGAMQSQFPELPKIETNVLAELCTLGQIVEQYSALAPTAAPRDDPGKRTCPSDCRAATGASLRSRNRPGGPYPGAAGNRQREDRLPGGNAGSGHGYGSRPGHRLDQARRNPGRHAEPVP